MTRPIALLALFIACAAAQFFSPSYVLPVSQVNQFRPAQQYQPFFQNIRQAPRHNTLGHRAVWDNAEEESHLPEHLKNPFYKNSRIGAALAKASWFTPGEVEVKDRDAEKIPRQKIVSILKNAGLA